MDIDGEPLKPATVQNIHILKSLIRIDANNSKCLFVISNSTDEEEITEMTIELISRNRYTLV
jgi:hypothetical protein